MGRSENIEGQAVIQNCEKHGQYEAERKYIELLDKWFIGGCRQCAAERESAERAEEARKDAERDLLARRKAGIPVRFQSKTLDTYDAVHDKQQIALAACRKLVSAMQNNQPAPNLILIGKPGTGKSHLCCGMVLELYRTHRVRRVDLPDLIREIRATWHKDSEYSEEYVLEFYGTLDLLIIEEVGTGAGTDDERARIFQVVNRRYESMLPTVIVSNLDMESLKKEIGERVIDRLREGERSLVVFDWQSHRGAA
jgi:DNA replication protein DnaC